MTAGIPRKLCSRSTAAACGGPSRWGFWARWSRCWPIENGRREGFVLADFFDYIGGTSTGAIIATGLSLGWSVDRLKGMYLDLGKRVFRKRKFIPMRAWSKYPDKPLHAELTQAFGNRTFGSPDLRTLLLIVMHNRTTNSPYLLSNNPKATYNTGESKTRNDLSVRLCDLLAASTAAPAFFPPFRR